MPTYAVTCSSSQCEVQNSRAVQCGRASVGTAKAHFQCRVVRNEILTVESIKIRDLQEVSYYLSMLGANDGD